MESPAKGLTSRELWGAPSRQGSESSDLRPWGDDPVTSGRLGTSAALVSRVELCRARPIWAGCADRRLSPLGLGQRSADVRGAAHGCVTRWPRRGSALQNQIQSDNLVRVKTL